MTPISCGDLGWLLATIPGVSSRRYCTEMLLADGHNRQVTKATKHRQSLYLQPPVLEYGII